MKLNEAWKAQHGKPQFPGSRQSMQTIFRPALRIEGLKEGILLLDQYRLLADLPYFRQFPAAEQACKLYSDLLQD